MRGVALLVIIGITIRLSSPILAQDSIRQTSPSSILKLSIGNPTMYLLHARYGMKYFGVGYEWFRTSTTSINGYFDYYYIKDGSYNNTSSTNYDWQLDNFGAKNIFSIRTLYKWYPFYRIKYIRGLYVAGGTNAGLRYTFKNIDDDKGDYKSVDVYAGLGYGFGYRIEVKKKISFEIFFHKASNGLPLGRLVSKSEYNPIGIDLLDFSVGYVICEKSK